MNYAETVLKQTLRRLLAAQVGLVVVTAAGFLAVQGGMEAVAALFGGGIALLNTLISALHLRRATAAASASAGHGMGELYIGAVIRFVATPTLVAVGIWALGLSPIAIIAGFAVAQLGYLANSVRTTTAQPNS